MLVPEFQHISGLHILHTGYQSQVTSNSTPNSVMSSEGISRSALTPCSSATVGGTSVARVGLNKRHTHSKRMRCANHPLIASNFFMKYSLVGRMHPSIMTFRPSITSTATLPTPQYFLTMSLH